MRKSMHVIVGEADTSLNAMTSRLAALTASPNGGYAHDVVNCRRQQHIHAAVVRVIEPSQPSVRHRWIQLSKPGSSSMQALVQYVASG